MNGKAGMLSQEKLQAKLEELFGSQRSGISVLLYHKGERYSARLNNLPESRLVHIGCVAKTLTATMIGIAIMEGHLSLDDSIATFFEKYSEEDFFADALTKPTIGQLLNHTSGLDHSLLVSLPKDKKGFIETKKLLADAGAGNRIPPGELFSYSHTAPWLAAAILEHIYQKSYTALLQEKLLEPLGMLKANSGGDDQICPSIGGDLRLSANALMTFALMHMHGDSARVELKEALRTLRTQYPHEITSGLVKGARSYPGWFDFGESFGQLGHGENSAGVIRFMPEQDIAIVITAQHQKLANAALAMLFREWLPDFDRMQPPKPMSTGEWKEINPIGYMGTFENAGYRFELDTAANGALRGKVFRKRNTQGIMDNESYIKRYYKAAENHQFLPMEPESEVCPSLQFSHPGDDGRFKYINTGNFIFSRVA